MEIEGLLGLSVQTQSLLASGYAAYLVAFRGHRENNSTADVVFATLVFGMPALGMLAFGAARNWDLWISIPLGFITAILIAAIWRKWVRWWVDNFLQTLGISHSSDHRKGWDWIVDCDKNISEICVERKDGTYLYFSGDSKYDRNFSRRPIHLGADGSIALRVLQVKYPGEDWSEISDATSKFGDRITFVPAESIEQIEIRYCR